MNPRIVKAYARKMGDRTTVAEAEREMVRIMQVVARSLANTYRFGYHSVEDIEQQGVLHALEVLEGDDYDVSRPLENFLSIHIRNRLSNDRRNKYVRMEAPCDCCDYFDPPANPCQRWLDWLSRNAAKQNIMTPLDISNIADESEGNMRNPPVVTEGAIGTELRTLIDREMPVDLRRDYLLMLDGKVIPKARRDKVREAVIEITKGKGYLDATETNDT